jgi:hypothetical protein
MLVFRQVGIRRGKTLYGNMDLGDEVFHGLPEHRDLR